MTTEKKTFTKQEKLTLAVKICNLVFAVLTLIPLILLLFSTMAIGTTGNGQNIALSPLMCFADIGVQDTAQKLFGFFELVALVVLVLTIGVSLYFIVKSIISLIVKTHKSFKINGIIIGALSAILGLYVYSVLLPVIGLLFEVRLQSMAGLLPSILILGLSVLFAVYSGIIKVLVVKNTDIDLFDELGLEAIQKKRRRLFGIRIELCIYAVANTVIAMLALLSNLFTVKYDVPTIGEVVSNVSGWSLLTDPISIVSRGQQVLSYIVFAAVIVVAIMILLTIVSFASRSDLFDKIALVSTCLSCAVCLAIGLIGKYYAIIQDMNKAMMLKIISAIPGVSELLTGSKASLETPKVTSNSILFFFGALAIVVIVFFRKPYTRVTSLAKEIEAEEAARLPKVVELLNPIDINKEGLENIADKETEEEVEEEVEEEPEEIEESEEETEQQPMLVTCTPTAPPISFDPCPTFTSIDKKVGIFSMQLEERRRAFFMNPSLPALVDFIVQYARDSRLHLFYTPENIAEFLAGLGTTRLSILQGMSGTGKTSLPKIVSEALCSICDIVEVESAWRDKNELLGYYNEFSKMYTPKKFTEALYKARLNPEVITFIVLDEMNLSRIEYYFSDFLSLMENEPDKREVKLLNIPIERTVEGEVEQYYGLVEGHTIKMPENVWFIGTANRDESTYDISDKVYDRAHTMNFDKRATKVQYYGQPMPPRYLPAPLLLSMFEGAKNSFDFNLSQYPVVAEVEKLLEPYNISFGNRIEMQIESFVKIYASCFAVNENVIRDGLEIILLSKVVRKLEFKSVDDKEELAEAFGRLQLMRCRDFILKLRED